MFEIDRGSRAAPGVSINRTIYLLVQIQIHPSLIRNMSVSSCLAFMFEIESGSHVPSRKTNIQKIFPQIPSNMFLSFIHD